ncbi:MAG: phosphoglycerate mutase [Micavibrio sp.]|nr:phosphoglycerate mutase [Micavibrio sp.]|tara:strand:- start:77 stop:688 length:612 start_codon:yes stop_codon:yes gene_type:complete
MTRLIIARHGNTFEKDQIPTRVGGRTDLPLVQSGVEQAMMLGLYLKAHDLVPDAAYCSNLQRTKLTAKIALKTISIYFEPEERDFLNEVDYGPDENLTEDKVIARIGEQAIKDWDNHAKVPDGWLIDPAQVKQDWCDFADEIKESGKTHLVVTSNGIARFAPYITNDFQDFIKKFKLKLSTGSLAILDYKNGKWFVVDWNIRP